MIKYIDTHGHLNDKNLTKDVEKHIKQANENNVIKIIVPGCTKDDSLLAIEIAKKFKNVFAMISIHPSCAKTGNESNYLKNINPNDIVGVGECGIDLYWENNPSLENQIKVFVEHIDFAKQNNLPIIVHMRKAEKEIFNIISQKKYKNCTFVIHCYTSTVYWVKQFIKIGCYISFSGILTFKNAKEIKEAAKIVPLNKILTETDAPYLAPEPIRGTTNFPANVKYVSNYLANLRSESNEQVLNALWNNAHKVFKI